MQQLTYGASDAFNALVYGEQHPSTVEFLRSQFNNATGLLTDAARSFYERAHKTFEHFNSNAAMTFARNAIQTLTGGNISGIDRIFYLSELAQLQQANLVMQRWLMANPMVRERYLDQRLDGYSDTYINIHGNDIGWRHYDFRVATNGVMQINDDGDAVWTEYPEELREGDRDLTLLEQIDIRDSWNAMNVLMHLGDDPTDPTGGQL
jgi:hypothetical protein